MKDSRKTVPAVNAGSMADIAFLLLIFFLVTTTISNDVGIMSYLPKPCPPNINCTGHIKERNVFNISLNRNNDIMVNNNVVLLNEIKDAVKLFIDNNGSSSCSYCEGNKVINSSEHPSKAIISLNTDREASYDIYIALQNELVGAYYDLRKRYSNTVFSLPLEHLNDTQLQKTKDAYPLLLSEVKLR